MSEAVSHETQVLALGARLAGLVAALQLARHGTRCMLVERNLDITKWPKMDITNVQSMGLLPRLGSADSLRQQGGQTSGTECFIGAGKNLG